MCWFCVAVDGAQTPPDKAMLLLTAMGLKASEVCHVHPMWIEGDILRVPLTWGCGPCRFCRTREKNARARGTKASPLWGDPFRARTCELSLIREDGMFAKNYILGLRGQLAPSIARVSEAAQRQGFTLDALQRWGPHFLQHRYGLDTPTICKWYGSVLGIHTEPPFRGSKLAGETLYSSVKYGLIHLPL